MADADGLCWRGLGRWRSAGWTDVTDYYEELPQKRSSSCPFIIVVAFGRVKFDASWRNSAALQAFLVGQAVNARSDEWGILGTRPKDEWPRVFNYEPRRTRRSLVGHHLLLWTLFALWMWRAGPRLVQAYGTDEWKWNAIMAVILGIVLAAKGFMLYLVICLLRETLRRSDCRVVVCPDWIELGDSVKTTRYSWSHLTNTYVADAPHLTQPWRYVLEIGNETMDFLPTIKDARLLAAIVSRYASNPGRETWRRQGSDPIGGAASRWSGGCEGVGERIFGYRTRTNRAFLWYLATFAAVPYLVVGLNSVLGLSSPGLPWGVTLSLDTWFFWCLWRYRTARVQTDAQGITQMTLFGKRFLAWPDVQDYYMSGNGETYLFGNIIGNDGRCIRFWTSIADVEELKQEIARRAIYCEGRTWEKKERRGAVANR